MEKTFLRYTSPVFILPSSRQVCSVHVLDGGPSTAEALHEAVTFAGSNARANGLFEAKRF